VRQQVAARPALTQEPAADADLLGPRRHLFTPEGGEAYLRDLPEPELVRLDSGHFAVEDCLPQISEGITRFYETKVLRAAAA
jgi:hypothetical protein